MLTAYKTIKDIPSEHTRNVILASADVFFGGDVQQALAHFNQTSAEVEIEHADAKKKAQPRIDKTCAAEIRLRPGKPSQ